MARRRDRRAALRHLRASALMRLRCHPLPHRPRWPARTEDRLTLLSAHLAPPRPRAESVARSARARHARPHVAQSWFEAGMTVAHQYASLSQTGLTGAPGWLTDTGRWRTSDY